MRGRLTAFGAVLSLLAFVGMSGVAPSDASAAVGKASRPAASPGTPVTGVTTVPRRTIKVADQTGHAFHATATTWPAAASARITLTAPARGAGTGARAVASGTPVWAQTVASKGTYTGPSALSVAVQPRSLAAKLGLAGVVWSVAPSGGTRGTVRVGMNYASFAQAYGGNYGSRLTLVALPACALTTPQLARCRTRTPLPTANDVKAEALSAPLTLTGAAVLAATSSTDEEGGSAGSYSATPLKAAGSWAEGGSAGSFTYSYPIATPTASSSLVPTVDLSYDSGSVDGQTSETATQSSWIGDGWSSADSYVEQSFTPCADSPEGTASPTSTEDQCYDGEVLTLSLNGSTTSIVYDGTNFEPADDNGETITHVTGSANGSGTYNTDYWVVTDRSGTKYEFGRNELPGWASGDRNTDSVDSEPVYSAHSGDPCYSSTGFTSSVCTMAYKWHLDYVVDVHGDAMAYYYDQATNYYSEDNGATPASYVRDSYLDHIDYGFRDGGAYGTVPDKVVYGTSTRCVASSCPSITTSNSGTAGTAYPDVPYDLNCAGTSCSVYGPSFWSTVRLTSITTEQYSTSAAALKPVDTYTLTESEPATGDGTSPTLWLAGITRAGDDTSAGGSSSAITLPTVSFIGQDLQNRVDTTNFPGLYRFRISSITTEMGSVIGVTYENPQACTTSYVASATPSSNTESCYPVYWTPKDYSAPILDWFEKYAVKQVLVNDATGGASAQESDYRYGNAAWHYDDNEVVKAKYRTYGQFRGFASVETLTGAPAEGPQTDSLTTYYQGMDGDWLSSSSTRSVSLTDSQGGVHTDANQLAGRPLETTAYLGANGPVDHSTIDSYWVSAATATRSRSGLPALTATWVATAETWHRQALTDGGTTSWRYTETDTTYDATAADADFGLPLYVYAHTVPAAAAYDSCAATTYAPANTSLNLVGLVASQETDTVACSGFTEGGVASAPSADNTLGAPSSVNRPAQVETATRTFYDDATFSTAFPQSAAPAKGDVTMQQKASTYTSGAFVWQITGRKTYDSYGRGLTSYDGDGNETQSSYTTNSVGLTTAATVTNAKSQTTSTTLDPTRGLTLTATDANGVVATEQYDALGRLTSVWKASRATSAKANLVYTYTVSQSSLSGVTTETMDDTSGYATSVTIYDSLGRTRQTQTATPQGGSLVSESFYDSHGWAFKKNTNWWDQTAAPSLSLLSAQDSKIPNQDRYTFDGLGRTVIDESDQYSVAKQTTTTVYNGDATTVIPPTGGVVKTTVTDPLGRTSSLVEYTAAPTLTTPSNTFTGIWSISGGTPTTTTYGYDGHGNQATTTDAAGNTWTSTFNLLGQTISKQDPDAGPSTMVYDGAGNLTQTTDARGDTVSYTYDALNRKTAEYSAATSAQSSSNELASWVYDNSNGAVSGMTYPIGHVTTETSYSGGYAYVLQQAGFNVFGESLGETVTIPSGAEGTTLGKSYAFKHTYTATTGLLNTDTYPAGGGLPLEIVTHTYETSFDLPAGLADTSYGYAQNTTYTALGQVEQAQIGGASSDQAYITDTYDAHTGALTDQLVSAAATSTTTPTPVDEESYRYDAAGNITAQTDAREGSAAASETQCYTYDGLDRLAAAWTATDACAATPTSSSSSTVGDLLGPSSEYWTTWAYNAAGERATQDQHALSSSSTDTTTSYTYNGNSATDSQAHTLTSTATSGGGTSSTSYTYDAAGDAATRNTSSGAQSLTWNAAGQLGAVTGASNGTSYIYDADGNLLLQKDPGSTVLYLPGEQLTLNTSTSAVTGVRYYALPGGATAVRTGTGASYYFELADQHGTAMLYLDNTAQTPTWRQFTPFGAPRGATVTWIDNRGFLNKATDTTTGLTNLGVRWYDPTTGAFISLDPMLDAGDPQSLNGYDYADNNPVGGSDPSGLMYQCDGGMACGDLGGQKATPSTNNLGTSSCDSSCDAWVATETSLADVKSQEQSLASQISWVTAYIAQQKQWAAEKAAQPAGSGDCSWKSYWQGSCSWQVQSVNEWADQFGICKGVAWSCFITAASAFVPLGEIADALGISDAVSSATASVKNLIPGVGTAIDVSVEGATNLLGKLQTAASKLAGEDSALSKLASCLAPNSFAGATPVLMADGTSKPIDTVKVGDKIADNLPGADAGTKDQTHVVTAVHITYTDRDYTDVTLLTPSGPKTITGTAHHLYWDVTQHAWTEADHLRPGDRLQTPNATTAPITTLRSYTATMVTYNLTVADLHTYDVEAGGTAVLVHNGACSLPGVPGGFTLQDVGVVADKIAAHAGSRSIPGVSDEDLPQFLEDTMSDTTGVRLRDTPSGVPRWGWWVGAQKGGTMIIREGNAGTFMQPDRGYQYFMDQVAE